MYTYVLDANESSQRSSQSTAVTAFFHFFVWLRANVGGLETCFFLPCSTDARAMQCKSLNLMCKGSA